MAVARGFEIDWPRYGLLPILGLPLLAGAAYYDRQRSEPTLSAMLACAAFFIVFTAGASLASYLLITVAGPRIDALLAQADGAMGFHWPSMMTLAAAYPLLSKLLGLAYLQ
jgi:hypothetical protein